jgi:hypothetical protein
MGKTMRNLRRLSALALLVVGVASFVQWAWTRYAGQVFDVPVSEAHRILQKTGLPPQVLGSQDHKFEVQATDPARIVWIVKEDGKDAMRFIADLSSAGEKSTRVHVDVAGPAAGPMSYVAARLTERRTIKNLYVMAMEEQVAAALQQREFSITAVIPAMMVAMLANMGDLNEMQERDSQATRKRYRDNLAKAYADEAAGIGPKP